MKILLLFVAALLIMTMALTIPIWVIWMVPKDTVVAVVSPNPQIIVGLFSFVIAVLAFAGGATYLLLRDQVHERVRSEFGAPIDIARSLLYSYVAYADYSKTWSDANFAYTARDNLRFRSMVDYASSTARKALDRARATGEGLDPHHRNEAIAALAYHLATQHHLWGNQLHRQEALALAGELGSLAGDEANLLETFAWVQIICNSRDTDASREAQKIIIALLRRSDLPRSWRDFQREKYIRLFRLDLPAT